MAGAAVFFGFIVIRVGVAQPSDTMRKASIPTENNAHLGSKAYEKAYPLEYKSYMKNNMMMPSPTGYGGSQVGHSRLAEEPEMVENFKGYKFAIQYDDDRGHTYAGQDILESKRRPGQKGSCVTCKTAYTKDVFYDEMGWGYATKTFDELAAKIPADGWFGCATCHDPETMNLRVMNPALVEALARQGKDIGNATHNEMRAYVCGQCHTEYYFAKEDGRVTLPWDKGPTAENQFQYYSSGLAKGFEQDWVHPDSGTKMLKAQHPDYETWSTSVHADAGVTCVDCHMPYMRDGGKKYTSHWMTSPLQTAEASCMKCHNASKEDLVKRVKTIHDNTFKLQRIAGSTVSKAHLTIQKAMQAGANDAQLATARLRLREAQWYWDYAAAENGVGFHNPDQIARTLGLSLALAHQAIEEANAVVRGAL